MLLWSVLVVSLLATHLGDRLLRRSFHRHLSTAAFLVRAGFLVVWLPLDVGGYRLVLARGWHGARLRQGMLGTDPSLVSYRRHPALDLGSGRPARPGPAAGGASVLAGRLGHHHGAVDLRRGGRVRHLGRRRGGLAHRAPGPHRAYPGGPAAVRAAGVRAAAWRQLKNSPAGERGANARTAPRQSRDRQGAAAPAQRRSSSTGLGIDSAISCSDRRAGTGLFP